MRYEVYFELARPHEVETPDEWPQVPIEQLANLASEISQHFRRHNAKRLAQFI